MASPYVEVILGVGFGVLVGVVPAVLATLAGAGVPSLTDRRYARAVVALLSLPVGAAVGVRAGVLAPSFDQVPRIATGAIVVVVLALYGFTQGARVGSAVRRDASGTIERGRPLSAAAITAVDASGQVTIRPSGAIRSLPGYPSLPVNLEAALEEERWRLPADLPLSELEGRIERQLGMAYDLAAVQVTVDPRGTASVAAAPQVGGIAHRVPEDCRSVSIATSVPEATTEGDVVLVDTAAGVVEGIVLSTTPRPGGPVATAADAATDASRERADGFEIRPNDGGTRSPSTGDGGGHVRLTVAVPAAEADALLDEGMVTVAVRSRDTRPDFRALSLLDRAGEGVRVTTIDRGIIEAVAAEDAPIGVFAARPAGSDDADDWTFDPSIEVLAPGWEAVLVGNDRRLADLVSEGAVDGEVIGA